MDSLLELAGHGLHLRVTPDIVGAGVGKGRLGHTKRCHLRHFPQPCTTSLPVDDVP